MRTRKGRGQPIAGAVLGAAIGDAMGAPTEFLDMDQIRRRFGPDGVQGFVTTPARYTDDTQLAEIVLETMIEHAENRWTLAETMGLMQLRFVRWSHEPQGGHRAPGSACLAGCVELERGTPWDEAGSPDAGGCGSVMRAYPCGIVYSKNLRSAEHWAVQQSKPTHRHPWALAACAAMAVGTAMCVTGEHWLDVITNMIMRANVYSIETGTMMQRAYQDATRGVGPEVTLDRLRAWRADEAIAAAVYVFTRHRNDVRAAILEAANTPGDSDSIATLVGALVGARNGLESIPEDWVRNVERSKELLHLATRAGQLSGSTT
jgi:ADP-ribosylglycohydrolase